MKYCPDTGLFARKGRVVGTINRGGYIRLRHNGGHASNKSGYLGVSWKNGKWKAQIRVNGKVVVVGRFDDPVSAHLAYLEAKRRHHAGCTI